MPSVFIVDDSPDVRRVVRTFIEASTPYKVCGEAGDGITAVEKIKQSNCDLIILDLRMPKRDGIETASTLRSMLPSLKIVGYTLFVRDLENRLLAATRFDLIVAKQDGLPKLGQAIGRLLRTSTGGNAASNAEFTQSMLDAFRAYQSGKPVIILDKSGSAIHGKAKLEAIDDSTLQECFLVRDVDVDQWNASEWPDILEATRQVYLIDRHYWR